jgi:hypothetical protein
MVRGTILGHCELAIAFGWAKPILVFMIDPKGNRSPKRGLTSSPHELLGVCIVSAGVPQRLRRPTRDRVRWRHAAARGRRDPGSWL